MFNCNMHIHTRTIVRELQGRIQDYGKGGAQGDVINLISSVWRNYQDCHENKMAAPLTVLRYERYLRLNLDFRLYEGLVIVC